MSEDITESLKDAIRVDAGQLRGQGKRRYLAMETLVNPIQQKAAA